MLFDRKNPKTELEGIDRAIEILNERCQKKLISIEEFQKKSIALRSNLIHTSKKKTDMYFVQFYNQSM